MKVKISDMMDYITDDSVNIQEKEIASANRIKEATMKRIEKESSVTNFKTRKISRVGMLVAVLALSMMFTGGVFAQLKWNGFANTSEMSKSEKEALLKNDAEKKEAVRLAVMEGSCSLIFFCISSFWLKKREEI